MARTKAIITSPPVPAAATSGDDTPIPISKIPASLRFPVLVALGLSFSSFLYTLVSPFTKGDLATVSGFRDQWWEIVGLLAWKGVELAAGWYGGYDGE